MENHHVVAAVLCQDERVLLCHRSPSRRWYPDVWDFPGGHIEPGERPEDALRREVREELGVDLDDADGEPLLRTTDTHQGLYLTVWVFSSWSGPVENRQPEEHDAIGWFGKEELSSLTFADRSYLPTLRQLLDDSVSRAHVVGTASENIPSL